MSKQPFAPIEGAAKPKKAEGPAWIAVSPVPETAPAAPDQHPSLGRPVATWHYRDAEGRPLGFVHRFDTKTGKEFRPLVPFRRAKGGEEIVWRWQSWDAPRPLYGLDRLAARPDAPVIVTEGEKACDAAGALLPDHVVVTSPNGSKSASKADWSVLRGRAVTIWPDADAAGLDYAKQVAELAEKAGAASVAIVAPPSGVPAGWDAADAQRDGWDAARARALIAASSAASAGDEDGGGRKRRKPQRDQLMGLTDGCTLWHGPDSEAYTTFPVNGHIENWPIRSQQFKRWLASRAYEQSGLVPGAQAVEDTLRVLEARATSEGEMREPWLRVGSAGGKLYLDLCDRAWRVIEIDTSGWRLVEKPATNFVRSPSMRPLPEPEGGYAIEELRRFVNVADESDFVLVMAWLLAAMRDRGPYPIAIISGEQGTGKSTFSRLMRSLVDPNAAPIRAAPKDDRDLIVAAVNGHVLATDNISRVEPWLSDALCRLATGGGFAARKLHTDRDEEVFMATRPIILNGIGSLAERADLAERAVTIRLKPIPRAERRPEEEFWDDWGRTLPRVLGALCDALSGALRRMPDVKLAEFPRMADFAKWATAAEPALGLHDGAFLAAYAENHLEISEAAFEANPVAVAIRDLLDTDYMRGWSGTATQLLAALNLRAPDDTKRLRIWPATPSAAGNAVDRAAPLLRDKGIHVERRHTGMARVISIVPIGG